MKLFFSLALVVISLLGILDASYITYEELSGGYVQCAPPFDCGEVLNSQWAQIGPIPVAILGLLFYLTVFILAILNVLDVNLPLHPPLQPQPLLTILTTLGFFFSLYLVALMAFVIKAWCLYCLFSAISSSLLFVMGLGLRKTAQRSESTVEN